MSGDYVLIRVLHGREKLTSIYSSLLLLRGHLLDASSALHGKGSYRPKTYLPHKILEARAVVDRVPYLT